MWSKNILTKILWWLKKTMKILRTQPNLGSVIMIILMVVLKWPFLFTSMENIEVQHTEVAISMLN